MINEDQVEQIALDWFKELGYGYLHGYDCSPGEAPDSDSNSKGKPQRSNYQEVLLTHRLQTALIKLC